MAVSYCSASFKPSPSKDYLKKKKKRILCSRRGKKDQEKMRIWWQRSPGNINISVSALETKQLWRIPLNIISASAWASVPPWCFLLICAFCQQLNWILKWSLLKLPLVTAINYSSLSAWQLPEMLIVGFNLLLLPSKIACKWEEIFLFFRHILSD